MHTDVPLLSVEIKDGKVVFHPIKDPVNVDERRTKMGLSPIEEYAQKLREIYLGQTGGKQDEK